MEHYKRRASLANLRNGTFKVRFSHSMLAALRCSGRCSRVTSPVITGYRSSSTIPFPLTQDSNVSFQPRQSATHALVLPLVPTDDKFADFVQTVKETVVPRRYNNSSRYYPENPFVYDRLCLIISRHGLWGPDATPDYILTLMQTLEGLRDTLSSTGIIKLNLGKLILPNPKEGVEFTPDALASFSIGLHSSEENEQYVKLYRTITDTFFNAKLISEERARPTNRATFVARPNTSFDITRLASALKHFGGPDIDDFDTPDPIDLDLGTFEIREVMLTQVRNWTQFLPERPLLRLRL
ncbi:hypothetical protein M422DRAFT_29506 [Sphaerobolus stellatus SS14]|uniref:Uncharacterized protein n=1 Tax=Sphaerobolus stellatus (strain SS14) TaxID=990650 RepID=A0A0C9W2E3_SPHS4|nr:hypothetical protein M422DRAFT_29506 [Sphaerobolus stellatus SS14]